jgi:hypothetical protein
MENPLQIELLAGIVIYKWGIFQQTTFDHENGTSAIYR